MKTRFLLFISLGFMLPYLFFSTQQTAKAAPLSFGSQTYDNQRPPNDTVVPTPPPSQNQDPKPTYTVEVQCAMVSYNDCKVRCSKCGAVYIVNGTKGAPMSAQGKCKCGNTFFLLNVYP